MRADGGAIGFQTGSKIAHQRDGIKTMFFSRWGYLVIVFFLVAVVMAGGISTAYHLSRESVFVLWLLLWGPLCVVMGRKLDRPKRHSALFWIPMEYWGYGIIALAILDIYMSWGKITHDWLAVG
jgi:hypothetical protein